MNEATSLGEVKATGSGAGTVDVEPSLEPSVPHGSITPIVQGRPSVQIWRGDGVFEPVDVETIAALVAPHTTGLPDVDVRRIAEVTLGGLFDGATGKELEDLTIHSTAGLIGEEPQYSQLAARLLAEAIGREVAGQEIPSFSKSVKTGWTHGLISHEVAALVADARDQLDVAIDTSRDLRFGYFGLRTLYDRYLLRAPQSRQVIETPQYFFLRVACGLSRTAAEAADFYDLISSLAYLPSSPTLFNSGTRHNQMSSCYLLDSPPDSLAGIYESYGNVARLSKHTGGIGIAFHRVRSRGSVIKGTNGLANGVVPFLKTLDSSVAAVNQGGRRNGAACVYLETWHADIEDFLELRDNTGDEARRTHNLNLANWIPDLFMRRVEADETWSLFDPKDVPELPDKWGDDFERAYVAAEAEGRFVRQVPAQQLYARMMRTLAQTGNGWMTFKDTSNRSSNQTARPENVIHSSNLCTEILEVTSPTETAVCNLGSINLAAFADASGIDYDRLGKTVERAVVFLDRVIDINFYPTPQTATSNPRWRPVGLGVMGLQDVFFRMGLAFDSGEARTLSRQIAEEIYFHALSASCDLAEKYGSHPAYNQTRVADGVLQPDLWGVRMSQPRWAQLRGRIRTHGLRNSLLVAIAPTATIASIAGCYECIEPQVSNLFKRETHSGEFVQINTYLVDELKKRAMWTAPVRAAIKQAEGSVQGVAEIPDEVKRVYRTVWELPQKALIDLAAERTPFIDQGQSLNLFLASPTIGQMSSMYMYAWKAGLKTTYYLRSRPATRISQTTAAHAGEALPMVSDEDAIACSLENPESCEACQ